MDFINYLNKITKKNVFLCLFNSVCTKRIIFFIFFIAFGSIKSYSQSVITTIAGIPGSSGYSGDGGAATSAQLRNPYDVAVDGSGNIYIADAGNHVIRKISTNGIITTIAGNDTAGYSGDGGPATSARLKNPGGVAVDALGNVYIADAQNNVVRKVNTSGIISTIAGNNIAGYSGDGGVATSAMLYSPYDVAVDGSGNIYIADWSNDVIRKVNSSGIISTIIGNHIGGYSGDGGLATSAQMFAPGSVSLDPIGNIYVSDFGNNVIRKVNTSGIITTIAGNNVAGYSGDGGLATSAQLNSPYGVAFDGSGNIYIADYKNYVIRKVNTSGVISTIAGNNINGHSGDGGVAISAKIAYPSGIVSDGSGSLYFAESIVNAVRKVSFCNTTVNSATICDGQNTTLTASGSTTYSWSTGATTTSITVSPTTNTSYTVTGTTNGCSATAISTVTVIAKPTVNSATICNGGNATLTASGSATYSWSTGATTASITVSPATNTSYTVTGTTNGCSAIAISSVTVNIPTISVTSASICNGQSTTLTASGGTTYSWSTGATIASITVSPTTNTSYTVTGTTNSCSTTAISTVIVNPIPNMSSTNTTTICSAVPVNFNFTSNVPSNYSWKATDNTSVTGESTTSQTSSILTDVITNTTTSVQKVTYTVTPASQTGNCVGAPQTFSVTVNPQPTMTSTNAKTICTGTAVGLSLTSNITSSYNWIASDNLNVTGESTILQTGATITNTLTNTSTAIQYVTYTVTPTAVSCNGTPQIVTIALMPKPIVTSFPTTSICTGNAVNLALTANVPSNYTWLASDNTNVTGESLTTQTTALITNTLTTALTSTQNVTYTITPTSQSGTCPGTAQTLTVTVNPKPAISSASTKTICSGSMVNLALTSSVTSTYSWKATDNTNITGESTSAQTSGTISDILNNITTTAQTVTYTITPTSNAGGCIGTLQTVTVTIYPNPAMTSANTKVLCSNTSVGLTFTSNIASSYNWLATDNANVTGESTSLQTGTIITNTLVTMGTTPQLVSYSVTPVSTTGLCPGAFQVVTVTVNPLPVMTSTNNVAVCNGNVVNLNFTSTIPGTYSWKATDNTSVTGESVSAVVSAVLNNTLSTTSAVIQNVNYTVTPTSQTSGCTGTIQTLTVAVVPKATVTSASAITACSGQTLNLALTASIPSTFTWLSATNTNVSGQSTSIQNTNVINNTLTNTSTAIQKITYTITPSSISGLCLGTPQTLTVTINPLPNLTNTNTAVICSGNALNIPLTTTIPSTYSWIASNNTNITGESTTAQTTTSITNTLVSSSASSQIVTYTITPTATSTLGACAGPKQQITVTVNPKPVMTSNNVVTICSGQTLNFALGSNVSSIYNWKATDNTSITGESTATQNTNTINNTLINTSTTVQKVTYSVTPISIGGNCIGTIQTVTVTANPAPVMTNVSAKTICTGTAVGLSLTSNIASSFIWQASDNVNVTGESTAQQTTTSITNTLTSSSVLVETVTYSVIPTATAGLCVGSTQLVTIAVSPKPTINSVLSPPAICSGAPVNYIVTSATPNALFNWSRSAVTGISQPASSGTGNINEVLSNTTTTLVSVSYTYTTSINGCSGNPQGVVVGVKPNVTASLTSVAGTNNQSLCINNPITTITYSVSGITTTNITALGLPADITSSYISPNKITIGGVANNSGVFTYSLSLTGSCFASPVTGTITVNPLPQITFSPASVNYTVGNPIVITASGANTYTWSPALGLSSTNGSTVTATPNGTTNYSVTATDIKGCVNTSTVTVSLMFNLVADAGSNKTVCSGSSISLGGIPSATGGLQPYLYTWYPSAIFIDNTVANPYLNNVQNSGTYSLTVKDANGAIATSTVNVIVNSALVVNAGGNQTVCAGTTVNLGSSVSGGTSPYNYYWQPSVGSVNNASSLNTTATPTVTTKYTLNVTDNKNCLAAAGIIVFVKPKAESFAGNDTTILLGDTILLGGYPTAKNGTPPYSYNWSPSSSLINLNANPYAVPTTTISYALAVSDASGCNYSSTDTVIITVDVKPSVFAGFDEEICKYDTIVIGGDPTVLGGYPPYTYNWSPTLGLDSSNISNPDAFPLTTTKYYITVTDSHGQTGVDSILVEILLVPVFNIGNDTTITTQEFIEIGKNLTVTSGLPPYVYYWSADYEDDIGDKSTLLLRITDETDSTTYYLVVEDSNYCQTEDSIRVNYDNIYFSACTMDSCTWRITGTNNSNFTINTGQNFCIDVDAVITGSITLNSGGTICNAGSFSPSTFNFNGGYLYNNDIGEINYLGNLNLTGNAIVYNDGEMNITGDITASRDASIINEGVGNITATGSVTINSGEFYNYGVVTLNSTNLILKDSALLVSDGTFRNVDSVKNSAFIWLGHSSVTLTKNFINYSIGHIKEMDTDTIAYFTDTTQFTIDSLNSYADTAANIIVCNRTENYGTINGFIDILDNSKTTTGPVYLDINSGTVDNKVTFGSNQIYNFDPSEVCGMCPTITLLSSVCEGDVAYLTASSNRIFDNYEFYLNNTLIQDDIDSIFSLDTLLVKGDKLYSIGYSFESPCKMVFSNTITIKEKLPITITGNTLVSGTSVTLSASGANSYVWTSVEDSVLSTSSSLVISPSNNSSYNLTTLDNNGCSNTNIVNVVKPLNVVYTSSNPTSENPYSGNIQLTINGGQLPINVLWQTGENTPYLDNIGKGTYTVTVMDNTGAMVTQNITLQ